jgi:hypothetical protein
LHYRDVSRIGSVGNKRFERARLTAELFFPDVHCPQGRLMKLTHPGGMGTRSSNAACLRYETIA